MITISQSVAILIDGNNIEMSIHTLMNNNNAMLNFNTVIEKLLDGRSLNRLIYFREGASISKKLSERLLENYHGSVVPCHKSADIPLTIHAIQLAEKVDTIIILSGDSDYVELVSHLRSRGVRVEIAAVAATTAAILIEEADYFTAITSEDCFVYSAPSVPQQKPRQQQVQPQQNKIIAPQAKPQQPQPVQQPVVQQKTQQVPPAKKHRNPRHRKR